MNAEQRIAALERQLNKLTLQLRGSPGVSTSGGAMSIRTMQLGFAAELTSSYDATTGYDWKRLRLDPPAFVDPGVQLTGENSFDIGGSTSLTSGTPVWMEPSPDAKGWIFTVSGGGGGSSSCTSIIGLIREGSCFTFSLAGGEGSCLCVDAQTTTMAWDDSAQAMVGADYIYGCAPGVVTSLCPDGAPRKFRIVAADFTGDCSVLNGTWTFTYSTGNTWTATLGSISATMVFSGSVGSPAVTVTFIDVDGVDNVVYSTTAGDWCCATIELSQTDVAVCDAAPASLTATPVTSCGLGTPYTPYLDLCESDCDGPQPRLRLVPATGSGAATITFSRIGCTTGGGQFSTSNPLFCTGEADTDCGTNAAVATVLCVSCGDGVTVCCPELTISNYLCVTFSNASAGLECLNDTRVFIQFRGTTTDPFGFDLSEWTGASGSTCSTCPPFSDPCYVPVQFGCYGSTVPLFYISIGDSPATEANQEETSFDCENLMPFTFTGVTIPAGNAAGVGLSGTVDITVTEIADPDDCLNANPTPTYNCLEDGTCPDPGDGSGEFTGENAYANCLAACTGGAPEECCPEACGQPAVLTIPDGPDADTYNATWQCASGVIFTDFGPGSGSGYNYHVACNSTGLQFFLSQQDGATTIQSGAALTSSCATGVPVLTFDGVLADGTATITVT